MMKRRLKYPKGKRLRLAIKRRSIRSPFTYESIISLFQNLKKLYKPIVSEVDWISRRHSRRFDSILYPKSTGFLKNAIERTRKEGDLMIKKAITPKDD